MNNALSQGHYFYVDAIKDGVLLYDSGECKLDAPRELNFSEIKQKAEKYYRGNLRQACDYWEDAIRNIENGKYTHSSFFLHQATEYLLKAVPLVFTLYRYKEHDLKFLLEKCKKHTLEIYRPFPQDTDEERRLFKLLQDAYVQSRYNRNFMVTKEDINALIPKVEQLRGIVERTCRERIAYYESQIRK